jgi:uncharacterized protein YndB with AHSA1/START domain
MTPAPNLSPIRRAVSVSWDPATAFRRFTADFADWWPTASHSIGAERIERIVFQCQAGGLIFEELRDGRRYLWGTITAWEPPRRLAFSWHPSEEKVNAQDVELRFEPEGSGTRVELVSSGWERLGAKAARARKGYDIGWGSLLDYYGGRKTATFRLFSILSRGNRMFLRLTGRLDSEIDKAGGRLAAG